MHDLAPADPGIRLGVARGIQYGLIADPDRFAARAERLGAGLLRVFFYWSQLEPVPGRYDWSAVDAVLDQASENTELWFMVGASSPWGSGRATDFLPASPPRDLATYARMVRSLVAHCRGRVQWWQCENEPSNPLFWVGSATEYLAQLHVFAGAVRGVDPDARVVLGGCPPGLYPAGGGDDAERAFFGHLLDEGAGSFDAFDIHLYGDPYQIPATITGIREEMTARGYSKPLLAGEYNGPLPVQYPDAFPALAEVIGAGATRPWHRLTAREFRSGELSSAEARVAMKRLYQRMPELPPDLQMFMLGCPEDLDRRRHRLNAQDVVIRNLLALSSGVRRTVCWQICPDVAEPPDRYEFLRLMFAKFNLLPHDDDGGRFPCADAFADVASRVTGAEAVRRIEIPELPEAYLFEVVRGGRPSTRVAWLRGEGVDDEPHARWIDRLGLTVGAVPTFTDLTASESAVP